MIAATSVFQNEYDLRGLPLIPILIADSNSGFDCDHRFQLYA